MPARGLRLRCRLLTLVAVLVPAGVEAQSSVTMKATVSDTVALSVLPNSIDANVVSSSNTVRITLSGTDAPVIRVPLIVRSNSGFKISAIFKSKTAVLSELSVEDLRATGRLVSPQIVAAVHVEMQVDPDTSQPLLVASGPRISLGGTLHSPNNALQITVLVRLSPQAAHGAVQITFVATKQL